ncbi:unnamed protein product [Cochlearia groenlandica]
MIRGGRNNITSAPAFSNDATKLLLCTANTISVFTVSTGLKIASLEGHRAPVTSLTVSPSSDKTRNYCLSASLDGKIHIWDFSIPILVKIFDTHFPIYSLAVVGPNETSEFIAYVSVEDFSDVSKDLFGKIKRFDLHQEPLLKGETLKEMEEPRPIVLSPCEDIIGVCQNCNIHLWNATSMPKETTLHHAKPVTVFAFHPNKRMLAAGDVTGRVLIWNDIGNGEVTSVKSEEDDESCTIFNWHNGEEVTVLNFSADGGASLYSGGKEGVLVVWELNTEKKQVLPKIKIESSLSYLVFSSDPTLSSVVCADNQIHLLNMPTMEILRTIPGIKPPRIVRFGFVSYVKNHHYSRSRIASIDRSSGIAAFSTANHCVQLYDLLNDREVSEVQVRERTHQPDDDEEHAFVSTVALSRDGSVMSTAEVKFAAGSHSGGSVSLKFWVFVPDKKTFSLSTVINQPHGEAAITGIDLNPVHSMAVTICSSVGFKIWVCDSNMNGKPEDSNWIWHGDGSYKKKAFTAAVFSGDGSLLAVAANRMIFLWHPLKNELMFVVGKNHPTVTELSFAGGFLVTASHDSAPRLTVWDLMTFGVSWSYNLYIQAIATQADFGSEYFAVLAWLTDSHRSGKYNEKNFPKKDGAILFFDGSGPKPVAIWTVMNAWGGTISFVGDGKNSEPLLAYINRDNEYALFDPFSDETLETSANDYEDLLEAMSKKKRRTRKKTLLAISKRPWERKYCGSTVDIPPFPDMCDAYFASKKHKRVCGRVERIPESHSQ